MYTLLDCIKHKCQDSYVLNIPTVHMFGLVLLLTHTLLVQTHTHPLPVEKSMNISYQKYSPLIKTLFSSFIWVLFSDLASSDKCIQEKNIH